MTEDDNEKHDGLPGPADIDAITPATARPASLSGSSTRAAKSTDDTAKEKRTEASIDDTDEASIEIEDDGPYVVSEVEQADGLSSAEKGTADGDGEKDHHNAGHNNLVAAISRIASNASSTLRRRHQEHHAKLDHIAQPKIPLINLAHGIVGWESEDDPAMPLNFSPRRKWTIITFLASMTLMTPFASSILAPGITMMDEEFHNNSLTLGSLAVSIYLLGYAVGPLLLAGLSELYGRHIVLTISNIFFCAWQIGCALAPSLNSLIVFRFFGGIGGSACMTLGGACISDLFPIEERGLALSLWTIGPLIGPSVGPLVGAWVAQTIGWRWDFWIVLIPGAINTIVMAVFSSETSHQVLIRHKVKCLSKELGRDDLRSCYDDPSKPRAPTRQLLLQGLVRPLKLLFKSPVLFVISLYIAFAYGCLYLLFNTIPMVFQEGYGWSTGITGLVYIPLGLGYTVGLVVFARLSDRTVVRLTKNNGGVYEPEMRLVDCIYFACCLPITFFWYGWAADKKVHWIVPVMGLFPYGFAVLGIWQPAQAFVIDGYGQYAASAIAAFTVFRSIVAAFLPLAGPSMYASLGVGWGNSVLGFICVAMIPVPLLLYRYGAILRKKYPLVL